MTPKPNFDSVGESNPRKKSVAERTRTTNEEGGDAYNPFTPEFALYKVVINNLLEDSYYDSVEESFEKVYDRFDEVADTNPEFVLQTAVYARHVEGLRDIPQLLLVLAANDDRIVQPDDSKSALIREYTPAIIDRTDEFNSVLSYQLRGYGKPVPKGLKKGIDDALHKKYSLVKDEETGETERVTYIYRDGMDEDVVGDEIMGHTVVDDGYVHDEYRFAKYSQRNKEVSLHDVLNLVRPTPRTDNRDELFGRIARGELDDSDVEPLREERTWESELSDDEDDRSDAERFRDRLDDMGIVARTRNLRNMREAGISGKEIFDYDAPDEMFGENSRSIVRNSKMFPFRFYQAYKAAGETSSSLGGFGRSNPFEISGGVLDDYSEHWLNEAIEVSTENLPDTLENTFTAVDLSGSMYTTLSNQSDLERAEVGALFGAMLMKRNSDVGAFATDFVPIKADDATVENTGTLELAREINKARDGIGAGTNGHLAIEFATNNQLEYDRFVVFTDTQLWNTGFGRNNSLKDAWDEYTQQVNGDADLYVIDLASYGDLAMPQGYKNVHQISGWSSDVIDFIDKNENADDVVAEIEAIQPGDY